MLRTHNSNIKKNERAKTALYKALKRTLSLGLGFILTLSPVQARVSTKLVNVFLADSGALIFETEDKKNIKNRTQKPGNKRFMR